MSCLECGVTFGEHMRDCPRSTEPPECTRTAGHSGPCNGLPRIEDGRYCYTLRSGHQEHHAYGGKVHVPYSGHTEAELKEAVNYEHRERAKLSARVRQLEAQLTAALKREKSLRELIAIL